MNELPYQLQEDRRSLMVVAMIAFLISLPFFIGAVHDWASPESVKVGGDFRSSYEEFKIDRYEHLTDKDIRRLELDDEDKMRQAYDKIAASHWDYVRKQTRRDMLTYGAVCFVSLSYFCFAWRAFRKDKQKRLKQIANETEDKSDVEVESKGGGQRERRGFVVGPPDKSQMK